MGINMITDQKWSITRYSAENKERWDRFVRLSKNGTFLLQRDYMDYHADRFLPADFLQPKTNGTVAG